MVGQIVCALDGPLAPIRCASQNYHRPWDDCDEARCEVRALMWDVRNAIAQILDHRSLADLSNMGSLVEPPKRKGRRAAPELPKE